MASSPLDRGSSHIDWCETNYAFHPLIAEYANTLSNCLFVVLPPLMLKLSEPYARSVNKGIRLIWVLFGAIGLSSMYFHATLSLLGQLLDELSILWLFSAAFGMWTPRRNFPKFLHNDRSRFQKSVFVISIVCTVIASILPWINAFFLMALGVPAMYLLHSEIRRTKDARTKRLGLKCVVAWLFAVGCWMSDRLFCEHWIALGFDYLHAIFHVLIAYTSLTILTLFAYLDAANEHPELQPQITFWPNESYEFAIPYVTLNTPHKY